MRDRFEARHEREAAAPNGRGLGRWLAVALPIAVLAAAPQARAADLPTFTVVMKQGRLHPETLEVPANTRFKIVVRNDNPGPAEFESRSLRKEKVLAPGASSFVVVAPQKPGEYDMFDEFHPATGKGRIVVK